MPIYEYYCRENHTIYQFYAKTLAQASLVPTCPDNPAYTMEKMVSAFAITRGRSEAAGPVNPEAGSGESAEDQRMEAALGAMEREFSNIDENDPRAMGRMMRRMAELTGERIDGEMEEVVRKLEEGMDPDALEEQLGEGASEAGMTDEPPAGLEASSVGSVAKVGGAKQALRTMRSRRPAPFRDPRLHDY